MLAILECRGKKKKSKMMEATIEKSSSMEMIARANCDEDSTSTEIIEDDKIKSTKYQMVEVRKENERLKKLLGKLMKDYHSLQEKFYDIQQETRKSKDKSPTKTHQEQEDADMVSLSLGIKSSYGSNRVDNTEDGLPKNKGLVLRLDSKFELESAQSIKNLGGCESTSSQEQKEEPTKIWPPSKVLETKRSDNDEAMQQSQFKKARVCVRARCDQPVMNDGCQWRKYGQKIAKGNPCPRAYYRCTVSPNCPVRKQVQRFSEDMSILITTYEETHNHALPISATTMAFTTSAAASMLQSRTSSSNSQPGQSGSTSLSAPLSMSTTYGSSHHMIHFPNSSISTLNSHPTITLDLTGPTNSFNFNRFSSTQRYSPTCLDFSSSSSSSHPSGYFNYGMMPSYNTNQHGLINLTRQPTHIQESIYQPFVPKNNSRTHSQPSLTEKIAAATKVITTNPTFQSALAAALTSYVSDNDGGEGKSSGVEGSCLNLKLGHDKSTSLKSHQQGSLTLFTPSVPVYTTSKSSSSSPADNKENS